MNTENIPKSFWYSLSLCMVIATFGLIYIAYLSSSVSIEIANAKIELSGAISQTKELKSELEIENDRLKIAYSELEQKLSDLEKTIGDNEAAKAAIYDIRKSSLVGGENSESNNIIRDSKWFEALDYKIQSAEQAIQK